VDGCVVTAQGMTSSMKRLAYNPRCTKKKFVIVQGGTMHHALQQVYAFSRVQFSRVQFACEARLHLYLRHDVGGLYAYIKKGFERLSNDDAAFAQVSTAQRGARDLAPDRCCI